MANPAPEPYRDLPQAIQQGLSLAFRNWIFAPPQNPVANQRQIITGTGQWVAIPPAHKAMAEGGEGVVHLWCLVDPATQTITDRVVVKQVMSGAMRFLTPRMWENAIVGGQPIECFQANKVWAALPTADRKHITSCLGWGDVDLNAWNYKLYMEYCEHATLSNLILEQKRYPGAARRHQKPLAEPFIWYMFEALAKVCVAMDQTPMIHGDMQAGNVFFGSHDPNRFGMYPVIKVADWGSARTITPSVRNRQGGLDDDPCCLEFAPPELSWDPNANAPWEVPGMQVSIKTNIWQVGMLMACAMNLKQVMPENDWRRPRANVPYRVPVAEQLRHNAANTGIGVDSLPSNKVDYRGPKKYSGSLVWLVMYCLEHNPAHRPRASALLHWIRALRNLRGTDAALARNAPVPAALRQYNIKLRRGRYSRWDVGRAGP